MAESHSKKMEVEQTSRLGFAWYTAAFSRAAKLPPLRDVIGIKKTQSKMIDEDAIIASFRSYQQKRDEEKQHGNGS